MTHISRVISSLPCFFDAGLPRQISERLPGRPAGETLSWDPVGRCYRSDKSNDVFFAWYIARLLYQSAARH